MKKAKHTKLSRACIRAFIKQGKTNEEIARLILETGNPQAIMAKNTFIKTERVVFNSFDRKWKNHPLRDVLMNGWETGEVWPKGGLCNKTIASFDRGELTVEGVRRIFGWKK